jgi:hypothetical protein
LDVSQEDIPAHLTVEVDFIAKAPTLRFLRLTPAPNQFILPAWQTRRQYRLRPTSH